MQLGELSSAIKLFQEHRDAAKAAGDRLGEEAALCNLGLAHLSLGEVTNNTEHFKQAIEYLKGALLICDKEIGDPYGNGSILFNMSLAFDALGDRVTAVSQAQAALDLFESIGNPYAERVSRQLAAWRAER